MTDVGGLSAGTVAELAMRALLDQHPDALVAAIDPDGLFVPMPDTVPLAGHRVSSARSALDLVQPGDHRAVIDLWHRVREEGGGRAEVTMKGASRPNAILHFFDVRPTHQVYVGVAVITEATAGGLEEAAAIPPPPPRLVRTRKNEIAVITWAEPTLTAMLGWESSEFVGERSLDFIHPDDQDRAISLWMECLSQPGYTCRARLRHQHRDGRWIWLELANRNLLDVPDAGYVDCEMFDISDEMAAHEAVRASEQLLRRLAEALPVGVAQFDLQRRLLYANERFYEILGAEVGGGIGDDRRRLLDAIVDRVAIDAAIDAVYAGEDVDIEVFIDRLDGTGRRRCTVTMRTLTDADGAAIGGVAAVSDVTDAALMRSELEQRATFDALTGCVNRETVMRKLSMLLDPSAEDAAAEGPGIAVVFVDLDDFKMVNDRHGHAVGDTLLAAAAARLREVVRGGDVVGRIGGDEFLVVCPDVGDADDARTLGDRIAATISSPLRIGALTLLPRASVGVAWASSRDGIDTEMLIAEADAAMYRAKHESDGVPAIKDVRRERCPAAAPAITTPRPTDTSTQVRRAMAQHELTMHFQPVVAVRSGAPIGCESLLRWSRDGRLVAAGEFLAELDASGAICEIGPWAFDDTFRQAAALRRSDLTWFVNLSPRELAAPRTINAFADALDRHGLSPASVVVEITEHGLLSEGGAASHAVAALDRLGVGLALDDFGTGWSSLSTVLSLPLRWLKIHRKFTAASSTREGAAVIASIVRLADGIGAGTIAEGVELDVEREAVEHLGVTHAQGYLFARPQPLDTLGLGAGAPLVEVRRAD